jgi:hypothetical protein
VAVVPLPGACECPEPGGQSESFETDKIIKIPRLQPAQSAQSLNSRKATVHDASASELGANKPWIEANGDEAQADGGQDGKTRSPDSGGVKRTHLAVGSPSILVAGSRSGGHSR